MKEIRIECITDLKKLIFDQQYRDDISRHRSSCLYRGLSNVTYHLETSLKRNCKDRQYELEKSILRNFTKYAATEDPNLNDSVWRQMIIGQHHGLPTRLMDWSYSPMVALHFANAPSAFSELDKKDCVVWKIDIDEINALLPEIYQEKLKAKNAHLFTIDMMDDLVDDIREYDLDMGNKSFVLLEPPSIDQRIINQYSYFAIIPEGIDDFEAFLEKYTTQTVKYIISQDIRWHIREFLDQMNINERTLLPGLDGISQWIKHRYYQNVKYEV